MLKLKPKSTSTDLIWLETRGVRLGLKPITLPAILLARRKADSAYFDGLKDEELPDVEILTGQAEASFVRKLAHLGLVEWEGVGDADGNPAPVTPENVDMLLEVWDVYKLLDENYVTPALVRQAEKNGSSTPPNGTSTAA